MLLVYKIPTRFAICFNCWRPSCVRSFNNRRMVCAGHSTIVVVVSTDDDRRANKSCMVCALSTHMPSDINSTMQTDQVFEM